MEAGHERWVKIISKSMAPELGDVLLQHILGERGNDNVLGRPEVALAHESLVELGQHWGLEVDFSPLLEMIERFCVVALSEVLEAEPHCLFRLQRLVALDRAADVGGFGDPQQRDVPDAVVEVCRPRTPR